MRPQSIVMFERLFLASLALSLLGFIMDYGAMADMMQNDPAAQQLGLGNGFMISIAVVGYALYLLLWYLIARRASNVAKWVLVVFVALGVITLLGSLSSAWTLSKIIGLAVYALEIAAVVHLFRPDAKAWLGGKGDAGATPVD